MKPDSSPPQTRHLFRSAAAVEPITLKGQQGVTLIELMVGLVIGLLTIAVAMGAIMVSRSVSGTVSDASQLQQQASYAFRIMSQQLRQAGSLRLNLAPHKTSVEPIDAADPVAFETDFTDPDDGSSFAPETDTVKGLDSPSASEYKLSIGYRNYTESINTPAGTPIQESLLRNCLGESGSNALIQSRFVLSGDELRCVGTGNVRPIIHNVADFQVRYAIQTDALLGNAKIQYVNAAGVGADWSRVFAVEVCLTLYGIEAINLPSGSTYKPCSGADVDMTTLTGPRKNRMHMTFRNVYQLRSQGLSG
jgi:type IV pilus assembly protein PilW